MRIKIFVLLVLVTHITTAQCAMCKAVIEGGNEDIAEGVNNGITYLMIYILYRNRSKSKN